MQNRKLLKKNRKFILLVLAKTIDSLTYYLLRKNQQHFRVFFKPTLVIAVPNEYTLGH